MCAGVLCLGGWAFLLFLFLIPILFWICVRDSRLEKCAWLFEQNVSRLEMPPAPWGECAAVGTAPLGSTGRGSKLPAFIP